MARDPVIDTIIAEALGEGPEGMAAVAHVILTRAAEQGISPAEVVRQSNQFTGYRNPGPSVAASMNDPAVRRQVEQIWSGAQSGSIANPYPGATHFHTPAVNPGWASSYQRAGQLGNHIFYNSGSSSAPPIMQASAPTPASASSRPSSNSAVQAIESMSPSQLAELVYANQGAQRNLPVSDPLTQALRSAVTDVYGPGYRVSVISGAQGAGSRGTTGSRRHTTGSAADVYVYDPQGNRLSPYDMIPLGQYWSGNNIGSVGFPARTGQSLHLDLVGGRGPGAVPLRSGEGRLWYYGTPSPHMRQALGQPWSGTPQYLNAYLGNAAVNPRPAPTAGRPRQTSAQGGLLGGLGGMLGGGIRQASQMAAGAAPQAQAAAGPLMQMGMSSLAGRTAMMNALMSRNIGPAPQVRQGLVPGGFAAMPIMGSSGGSGPVTLMAPSSIGAPAAIYRANRAAIGGPIMQSSISNALANNAQLYAPASDSGSSWSASGGLNAYESTRAASGSLSGGGGGGSRYYS